MIAGILLTYSLFFRANGSIIICAHVDDEAHVFKALLQLLGGLVFDHFLLPFNMKSHLKLPLSATPAGCHEQPGHQDQKGHEAE